MDLFISAITFTVLIHASPISGGTIFFGEIKKTGITIIEEEQIDDCYTDESVNLSGLNLVEVPNYVIRSAHIQSLSLEQNELKEIPSNLFDDIPNLQCLNLAHNKIPISNLLNFAHPRLKTLVQRHQENVKIDGCTDVEITDTFNMSGSGFPSLEYLDLSGISFTEIPNCFNKLFPRLTHFYVTDAGIVTLEENMFYKFPATLKSLHLEGNALTILQIPYASNIEELYLDRNPVSDISRINGVNLKTLSLSGCFMETVYEELLDAMPNLRNLNLSKNLITDIHPGVFVLVQNLENLSLNYNKLIYFPNLRNLRNLKGLSLNYNLIGDLTSEIPVNSSLEKLSLRGNRLNRIEKMAFSMLHSLEELDLGENKLQVLPDGWTDGMPRLRYLNLEGNKFAYIHDMMIGRSWNLRELFIKGNLINTANEISLKLLPEMCVMYVV